MNFLNLKPMFVLRDLTYDGYLQIKKDKELLIKKIQQHQALVDEFNLALPFLEAIYEPKIKFSFVGRDKQILIAYAHIPINDGKKYTIRVTVGNSKDYPLGEKDFNAQKKGRDLIKDAIKNKFPLHFQD
jgi:hypothetical protein